ncbi:MAG: ComEC/Rec2 family competence protein [Pseudorhodoplanes sp.]|nr:ComEC/Rec2 family competence protein [Pseudorhodoplanes sp.]
MGDDRTGKTRARTWPSAAPGRAGATVPVWLQGARGLTDLLSGWLRAWIAAEIAPGRLVIWLPVAFGIGVILYFAADREPFWWAALLATAAGVAAAIGLRNRAVGFPVALGLTAVAAGFAAATMKSQRISHPVLPAAVYVTALSGFVETREERERTDRIVIAVHTIEGSRLPVRPDRVRLSVRKGTAPPAGAFVSLRARLMPPLQPLRPGGYDFARDLYFQGIGATGFVLGAIRRIEPPRPPDLALQMTATISAMRDAIDARIRTVVPGDRGAIASALITGKRDAISAEVNDAMYVSSLAHVLSISGYHMAVVAGVIFFAFRAGLALVPALANRRAIKKWAAVGALTAATFYLLLSGAEIATRRAYIMTAIVLIGVMFDRSALTLRTIAVAALVLLLVAPEAIVHPSFQMSFAATLALIAVYERGLPWFSAVGETRLAMKVALWGGRELLALVVASAVAGCATTLFAAYHFHRLAPYGVLANLAAMPIVSAWVMPAGLLALITAPFGFDGPLWQLMGEGIARMTDVALWVSRLPGAVGRISAFGVAPLLLGTAGIVVLCLLRSPLRFGGAVLLAVACGFAATTRQPDVLVSADARMVAVRTDNGRYSVMSAAGGNGDAFTLRTWLAADGDGRQPGDESLSQDVRCDKAGCVVARGRGITIAQPHTPEAAAEDCERATVVIWSSAPSPAGCRAMLVDAAEIRASGAIALLHNGENEEDKNYEVIRARPRGQERPWMHNWTRNQTADRKAGAGTAAPTALPDVTPRTDDVAVEDP